VHAGPGRGNLGRQQEEQIMKALEEQSKTKAPGARDQVLVLLLEDRGIADVPLCVRLILDARRMGEFQQE
jgi:hypothetical protein